MTFWTSTAEQAIDPKRNFRFKLRLFGEDIWYAKDVVQPQASVTEATHDFLTHKFYFPSKVSWNEVQATLVDPVTPGALENLISTLEQSGYVLPLNEDSQFQTISKPQATTLLSGDRQVTIDALDADGLRLHRWVLNNAFIKQINPSQLSYTNDELMTIQVSFRYDWATFKSFVDDQGNRVASGTEYFNPQA